jgi:hypothetical protein
MDNPIDRIDVSAYTIPTDYPESDGTFEWNQTTIILVEAHAGGRTGIGYSYGDLIIGDGKLNLLPFDALRDSEARYVLESYASHTRHRPLCFISSENPVL